MPACFIPGSLEALHGVKNLPEKILVSMSFVLYSQMFTPLLSVQPANTLQKLPAAKKISSLKLRTLSLRLIPSRSSPNRTIRYSRKLSLVRLRHLRRRSPHMRPTRKQMFETASRTPWMLREEM